MLLGRKGVFGSLVKKGLIYPEDDSGYAALRDEGVIALAEREEKDKG